MKLPECLTIRESNSNEWRPWKEFLKLNIIGLWKEYLKKILGEWYLFTSGTFVKKKKKRCKSAAFTSFIPVQFSLNLSVVHHVHALLKIKMLGPSQVLSVPALTSYGRPEELRTQVAMLARLCLQWGIF